MIAGSILGSPSLCHSLVFTYKKEAWVMEELISSVYLFSEIIILCSQFLTGLKRIISLILSSFLVVYGQHAKSKLCYRAGLIAITEFFSWYFNEKGREIFIKPEILQGK